MQEGQKISVSAKSRSDSHSRIAATGSETRAPSYSARAVRELPSSPGVATPSKSSSVRVSNRVVQQQALEPRQSCAACEERRGDLYEADGVCVCEAWKG